MSPRSRRLAFAFITLAIVLATGTYLVRERLQRNDPAATDLPQAVTSSPDRTVFFRDSSLGERNGYVSVATPTGVTPTGRRCVRLDVTADLTMACLDAVAGVTSRSQLTVIDPDGKETGRWKLPGIPSRTRLSPSGRLFATTTFVAGHSYTDLRFSTQTLVGRTAGGKPVNLEDYELKLDGKVVRPVDRNLWGVTFAPDDRTFYATVSTDGRTWLVRGDLESRTLASIQEAAECPSLSPDGTRVAYKKRDVLPDAVWTLAVLDLATGEETLLDNEQRSVDDQVMWLDEETLLYGLPDPDTFGTTDVWALDASGQTSPRLLLEDASSPSVPEPSA